MLVGGGRMGHHHARAIARGGRLDLVAVVDPRPPAWTCAWQPDLDRFLEAGKADLAIVAVPPELHSAVAGACLEAGLDVLLEKPLCPASAAARDLAARFGAAGRILFGGHSERFHPVFLGLADLKPEMGRVLKVDCLRVGPRPQPPPEGGALLDLGIHDLDLLQRWIGRPSWEWARSREDGSREASGRSGGVEVSLRCGYAASKARRWRIETDSGTWTADFAAGRLGREDGWSAVLAGGDALEAEHAAFLDARNGDWRADLEPQIAAVEQAEEIDRLAGGS